MIATETASRLDDFPDDANETTDSDMDGDDFPDDANETTDSDGDGVGTMPRVPARRPTPTGTAWATMPTSSRTIQRDGRRGRRDNSDESRTTARRPTPRTAQWARTTDYDGDGVGDNSDDFPNDASEASDMGPTLTKNGCSTSLNDGDGRRTRILDFPIQPIRTQTETRDNNLPERANETTDTDGDGVGNNSDEFPNDPNEW